MKKVISLLLVFLFVIVTAGCGGSDEEKKDPDHDETQTTQNVTTNDNQESEEQTADKKDEPVVTVTADVPDLYDAVAKLRAQGESPSLDFSGPEPHSKFVVYAYKSNPEDGIAIIHTYVDLLKSNPDFKLVHHHYKQRSEGLNEIFFYEYTGRKNAALAFDYGASLRVYILTRPKKGIAFLDVEVANGLDYAGMPEGSGSSASGASSSGGSVPVVPTEDTTQKAKYFCIKCQGSGKIDCSRCDGRGKIEVVTPSAPNYSGDTSPKVVTISEWRNCDVCYGTGKVECPVCGGKGKV